MKIVIFLLFFIMIILSKGGMALTIEKVKVSCNGGNCDSYNKRFLYLKGDYSTKGNLEEKIRIASRDKEIDSIKYDINEGQVLLLDLKLNTLVNDVKFYTNREIKFDDEKLKRLILIKPPVFYNAETDEKSKILIEKYFADRGHSNIKVSSFIKSEKKSHILIYDVLIENALKVKSISFECNTDSICEGLEKKIRIELLDKQYNFLEINNYLTSINNDLIKQGHIFSQYQLEKKRLSREEVSLKVSFKIGDSFQFFFEGQKIFSFQELKEVVLDVLSKTYKSINENTLVSKIKESYENRGFYGTTVKVSYRKKILNKKDNLINHFYILKIKEGERKKLLKVSFQGNNSINLDLNELFYKKAPITVKRGYFLKQYIADFRNILKDNYLKHGFLFAEFSPPKIRIDEDGHYEVFYKISEGEQTTIEYVNILGTPKELIFSLKEEILNKEKSVLNLFNIQGDIDKIESYLRDQGYYYARVINRRPEEHLFYDSDYKKVEIRYQLNLGEKIHFNKSIITGNERTKTVVIDREIDLSFEEIITPKDIEQISENLVNLGIFSDVRVDLLVDSKNKRFANLLINVKEKDSGVVELAPGYRTDLGLKLSFGIGHNNILGMNRTLAFRGMLNQRLNMNKLNNVRERNLEKKIEHQTNVNYIEPALLGFPLTSSTTAGFSSKRYYKYDAETLKVKTQLLKDFGKIFSPSIFYQLESIKVKEANDPEDNGYFRIGAIVMGPTLDLRDDAIYPTKGAFFDISYEYSHPNLYSQNRPDHEIHYDKLVSYSSFYFPFLEGVFAFSWALGVQRDLVKDVNKRQRIPKFKVFRLNGIDMVRGYTDEEINKLKSGKDINDIKVDRVAYFSNFKFEPRFYWDDNVMMGPFFDAGRLFVNHFKPLDLRYSVGLSVKFLTPVGPIDLSYGVKPRRYPNEDFGQFTISVGPF